MSPDQELTPVYDAGFPRVSGDEPRCGRPGYSSQAFSPRERG